MNENKLLENVEFSHSYHKVFSLLHPFGTNVYKIFYQCKAVPIATFLKDTILQNWIFSKVMSFFFLNEKRFQDSQSKFATIYWVMIMSTIEGKLN